jgi:hypothetical protein
MSSKTSYVPLAGIDEDEYKDPPPISSGRIRRSNTINAGGGGLGGGLGSSGGSDEEETLVRTWEKNFHDTRVPLVSNAPSVASNYNHLQGGQKVNRIVHDERQKQLQQQRDQRKAALAAHAQISETLMNNVRSRHASSTQVESSDRLRATDLAKIFFRDGEQPIHEHFAFQCKSIQIERSRISRDVEKGQPGYYMDEPLEELPGRTVVFTNQRIIITDASYAVDVKASLMSLGGERCDEEKSTSSLFKDVASRKLRSTLLSTQNSEGVLSESDFILAGSPSANVPVLSSAPARNNSVTTVDWRYFRAFPLSVITDLRFDFVSATRTQGKISYTGGQAPEGIIGDDEEEKESSGCCSFLFGSTTKSTPTREGSEKDVEAPPKYGTPQTNISDHVNSKRQVFFRIKDQGSIAFDISSAHSTSSIAECMAALLPRANAFEELNQMWKKKMLEKDEMLAQKDINLAEAVQRCRVLEEAVAQLANVIGRSEPGEEEVGHTSLLAKLLLGQKNKIDDIEVGQKKE